MKQLASVAVALFCLFIVTSDLFAQNTSITIAAPDFLYVCGEDTVTITVKNTSTTTLNNVTATVTLPTSVLYVSGSVTGATEQNLSNLSVPIFSVATLGPGAEQQFKIRVLATCDLIPAINTGQLFTINVKVNYTGGMDQVSSVNFKVETGLLVISSAAPQTVSAELEDMPLRTYVVKNTRLGPIHSLSFVDLHFPGFTATILGGANETNNPVLFTSEIPGSYFTAFGDGDELLEFNEEITITEKLTITDCGTPSFDNPSRIRIGWGCSGDVCQYDSTDMEVTILPSSKNPLLKFIPKYGTPVDYCTNAPSTNEVMIINEGAADALDVILDFRNGFLDGFTGMDPSSFQYSTDNGQTWFNVAPSISTPIELQACGTIYNQRSLIAIPKVEAFDTVLVRYQFFTCFPDCNQALIPPYFFTFYRKPCPEGATVSDSTAFVIDSALVTIRQLTRFDIKKCLIEGESYNFNFTAVSDRLLTDTTYFQARIILPKGMLWDSSCVTPTIEGQSPIYSSSVTDPDGNTTVVLSFDLPFDNDSINMPFCLKFVCDAPLPCMETLGMISQEGGNSTAYPIKCENQCGLKVTTQAAISYEPDVAQGCGMTGCHLFMLNVEAPCMGPASGGGSGIPAGLLVDMRTYRINYGLKDSDDNRVADDNVSIASPNEVRLDRYMPGDTLRYELKGVVIFGEIGDFPLQINTEVLQSDFGLLGGDQFNLVGGRTSFSNKDSLFTITSRLRIKRADGTEYECNAPQIDYKHQNFISMEAVNIQPPQTLDRFLTMYKTHLLSVAGCSPDGQGITTGDSLFYTYEYQFRVNYAPPRAGGPPPALINFRNVVWDEDYAWTYPDSIGWPRYMSQYSGYVQSRSYPKITIRPCDTSLQTIPFAYGIRLARENMFPFEVRQIAEIANFEYRIPPDATLLSATANLNLQENVSWIQDTPIPWTVVAPDHIFDFATTVFELPIDEGFNLRTDFVFDESCSFRGPDTSQVRFVVRVPEAFPSATELQYTRRDATGFLDAAPLLSADFNQTFLNMSSENFEIEFALKNLRPAVAPNTWVYVQPLNGTLSDTELILLPTETPAPGLANLFQLGQISLFGQQGLRLKGKNSNCESLQLRLIFGWDCDPVTNPFASTCGRDTVDLDLRLRNAVLELDVINQPTEIPLCEASDYFTFEVSNANDGNGLGIIGSVKLPQGITVVPGSAQVQYPSPGGPWVNIGDPTEASGNVFLWEMNDILPSLINGLPGFNMAPQNAFRIRFRVLAECGFVANSQPIYGVDGIQPCGSLTNSLRKPDDPIGLEGVNPAYDVDIALTPANPNAVACGDDYEIAVQLVLGGTPLTSDSVYLNLPAGVTYVPGSYAPGQNAPAGQPQQVGQTLQLGFNSGLTAGSVVKFNIKIKYDNAAGCLDKFITAQTRQRINGFCATINQSCTVYLATGEALLQIPSANPDLKLALFEPGVAGSGSFTFNATLENVGLVNAPAAVMQLWLDQNGNGLPDPGEQLLQTVNYGQIQPGGTATQNGTLNIPLADICKLLAVLPAEENCACVPKYFPLEGLTINQGTIARCDVEPVTFGVPNTAGHTYLWQPTNLLSCNNCAQPTFTPDASVDNGDFFTYVLLEQSGSCTIQHIFEIRFGEALGINTPDQTICKGDTVTIQASPGGTYQWSGPGVNPTAQQQILAPGATSVYSVTVTLSAGCTGTDIVQINVLEPTSIQLPPVQICAGSVANILGDPQTQAGTYCKTFTKSNGCDSTVCVVLNVAPVSGATQLSICTGDSIAVFPGQIESVAGEYCKQFINSAGCDSTHCVTLKVTPPINLPNDTIKISVVEGGSVTLNAPGGFSQYNWTPTENLSCTDCQSPTATPPQTINYKVAVSNDGSCGDTAVYRVLVVPPCFEGVQVPNAFTPGNGWPNDSLQVVMPEGAFERVVRLQVYNRWGQRIYDSSINPTWDGTVGGKPAPMDVYIYIFDVECNGETRRLPQREVTLIR